MFKTFKKKDGIIIADNVLFRGMVASDDLVKKENNYC